MPRYFFHLRHGPAPGQVAIDDEGDDIADVGEVREHALRAARDLIARTRIHSVRDWFECSFEVTDERGARVLTVPFGDTVPDEED